MGEMLIETIAQLLKSKYPNYDVINDKLEQDFERVFLLTLLPFKVKRYLGDRFLYKVRIGIDIFDVEMNNIMLKSSELFELLEVIEFNNEKIRGVDYDFSIFHNIGKAYITYNIWVYKGTKEDPMERLKYKGGLL